MCTSHLNYLGVFNYGLALTHCCCCILFYTSAWVNSKTSVPSPALHHWDHIGMYIKDIYHALCLPLLSLE